MPEEKREPGKTIGFKNISSNKDVVSRRNDFTVSNTSIVPTYGEQRLESVQNNRLETLGMTAPEKEMELLNQKFLELQAFIEDNKQKIEKIERYDEVLKENIQLKEKLESIAKSNSHLENNQLYAETLVRYILLKTGRLYKTEVEYNVYE